MHRFELVKSKSVTFVWEVALRDSSVTTRFGKAGSEPEPIVREFPSAVAARKEFERLIGGKKREGYVEVDPGRPQGPQCHPELEAAIEEDPSDHRRWLVYADWLQSQGDPRGELMMVQHALATERDKDRRTRLQQEAARILDENERHFFGFVGEHRDSFRVGWRTGFAGALTFRVDQHDYESIEELLPEFLGHPSARFLRELVVEADPSEFNLPDMDLTGLLAAIGSGKSLPSVQTVSFRRLPSSFEEDRPSSFFTELGELGPLCTAFPAMRRLAVSAGGAELRDPRLPATLEELELDLDALSVSNLRDLQSRRWPSLKSLVIWFGRGEDARTGWAEDVEAVLDGARFPVLENLGLRNVTDANDLCAALADSKVLRRLRSLDLAHGAMNGQGAALLANVAGELPRLETLDVTDNALEPSDLARLAGVAKEIRSRSQRPGTWEAAYRYDPVDE